MQLIEEAACFGGTQQVWQHDSAVLSCPMRFGIYLPAATQNAKLPVLYWLSGLTCTEQNFITKAGAQRYAAEHNIIIVAPDTSPRGADVADDESYDLGQGAGFYLNAQQQPWAAHYRMEDYIMQELPAVLAAHFPVNGKAAVSGHSMGGHGALVLSLRHPGRFCSVSAFAPIAAPGQVPWGQKAFRHYLGEDESQWRQYDAAALLEQAASPLPLLIDQGSADRFLDSQLRPERLLEACRRNGTPCDYRLRESYDHSYYFVSSFIGEHIAYHAAALHAASNGKA